MLFFGSQQVVLFWEQGEHLGGGTCLAQVGNWGQSVKVIPDSSFWLATMSQMCATMK